MDAWIAILVMTLFAGAVFMGIRLLPISNATPPRTMQGGQGGQGSVRVVNDALFIFPEWRKALMNLLRHIRNDEDPIAALKSYSGDPDGLEVLAIIIDLLSTGYAHIDAGTPDEAYVFPYFAGKPLNTLTAPEKVELLRIITAGDLADMQEYGNYSFYRVGISPDGKWKFFTAGD